MTTLAVETTAPATPSVVKLNAPDGILRLFVPDGLEIGKGQLRNIAAKLAGTVDVGRVPAGKRAKLNNGTEGATFDFSPVVHRGKARETAENSSAPAEDPRAAVLRTLGISAEMIPGILATMPGAPSAPAAPAKATKELPEFIVRAAEKRAGQAAKCDRCLGFGRERSVPREKGKYPHAFRTQHGADTAPTGRECQKCHGKARKTA